MTRKGTKSAMDKDLSNRGEEKEKRELLSERMQTPASVASGDLETDDSVVSLQVLCPD